MDTQDILKKVRKIEIKTRGLSQNIFAGQYHSAFKGRGMAFTMSLDDFVISYFVTGSSFITLPEIGRAHV